MFVVYAHCICLLLLRKTIKKRKEMDKENLDTENIDTRIIQYIVVQL